MEVVILKKKIYKGGVAHGKEVNGNGKYAFFIFSAIANGEASNVWISYVPKNSKKVENIF